MAGVLETFYILFETDADKAADDVKKLDGAADKVEGSLKRADGAARALGASFVSMARNFAAPLLSIASVAGAVQLAFSRISAIDDIADAAGKMRSSAEDYDAFTRAVQSTGGELAAAGADVAAFSDKLSDAAARPDGPNAKNFAKWGILFKDAKGNAVGAVDGIVALAKSLEGLDQAEAIGRLRKLGITDADTIAVLLEGKEALLARMDAEKKAGVVTEEQIAIAGEYQAAMGKSRNLLDSFGNNLMEMLIPAVTAGMEAFNRAFSWLLSHGKLVEGFFVGAAAAVTAYFLPAMARAAAATIAATWPFLAIAAAVALVGVAFALVYEDVRAFMDGQPSLIGSLAEKYESFAAVVAGIGEVFKWLGQEWGVFVGNLTDAWTDVKAVFDALVEILGTITGIWTGAFSPMVDAFRNLLSAIGDIVSRFSDFASGGESAAGSVTTAMDLVRAAVEAVGPVVTTLAGIFTTVLGGAVNGIAALVNGIADAVRAVGTAIAGLPSVPQMAAPAAQAPNAGLNQSLGVDKPAASPGEALGSAGAKAAPARPMSPGEALGAAGARAATPGSPRASLDAGRAVQLAAAQSSLGNAARAPQALAAAPVQMASNTSNVTVGNVTVNTQATDAKGVAAAVRGALKNELRTAAAQFDDGVAA